MKSYCMSFPVQFTSLSLILSRFIHVVTNASFHASLGLNCILLYVCTEKAMAPHSSTLAWKIPWTEEPGRLQSMWSLRVRHDWAASRSLFTFMHWRRKWQTHSSALALRIPGTGEPYGLPSLGSHRVGHDWSDLAAAAAYVCTTSSLSILLFMGTEVASNEHRSALL